MLVVIVNVHVVAEGIEAFREATLKNARASLKEPGISRFDVLQQKDDASRFVLVEGYLDDGAPAAHKQTAHYLAWRDTVGPLMASPRTSQQFEELEP